MHNHSKLDLSRILFNKAQDSSLLEVSGDP